MSYIEVSLERPEDSNIQPSATDRPDSTGQAKLDQLLGQGRRPFEVILKGGSPWGFALNGGAGTDAPLHISKIVPEGKASESALIEGDFVLKVNELPCLDVGEALDIVDTAINVLSLTVLRGQFEPSPTPLSPTQSYLQRAYELQQQHHKRNSITPTSTSITTTTNNNSGSTRVRPLSSDDTEVYTQRARHRQANMRPSKRRGDSFNVGRLSSLTHDTKLHYSPQSPNWPGHDTRKSLPSDGSHHKHDNRYKQSPLGQQDTNMNRRRSEGQRLLNSSAQPQAQLSKLLSMKSSPNLAKPSEDEPRTPTDHRIDPHTGQRAVTASKSSPNIPEDSWSQSVGNSRLTMARSSSGYGLGGNTNPNTTTNPKTSTNTSTTSTQDQFSADGRVYSSDMYTRDMSPARKAGRRSLPAQHLQRYQPDYENVSHLGTAPLRSEKISEIDDIDDVTGRDHLPMSPPDAKLVYDPHTGPGLPTRDLASLKYIKVNQSHEKYPSWPVTKPNGASDHGQSITTRAQSMTDNTNTSKEFPKKQRLAYQPGLRPLMEGNNGSNPDKKGEDGKSRNTSDPGFKSEFVYDRYGRVRRRDYENIDKNFEHFYLNSKPGYPPPNMDSDGHNIGDKNYNVPSPPERDSKGVDRQELSNVLGSIDPNRVIGTDARFIDMSQSGYSNNRTGSNNSDSPTTRPTNLRINSLATSGHGSNLTDSATSPIETGSPISLFPRQGSRTVSTNERLQSPLSTKQNSPSGQAITRARPSSQHDTTTTPPGVQRERPGSYHQGTTRQDTSPHDTTRQDTSHGQTPPGSGEKAKSYIVKSTPYYNTSTQTDNMMPYAVKVSDPLSAIANRQRNAEIQVGEFATQTSPKSPMEEQSKAFGDKSVQARMSRDFQGSDMDTSYDSRLSGGDEKKGGNYFQYSTNLSAIQNSPFHGIESIQAKYATDEDSSNPAGPNPRSLIPQFSDNSASILRKLSEEFYKNRHTMTSDKRISSNSSQETSPRFDPVHSSAVQQPGMREAESYSSVVIHHNESSGLFGRDDYGSVSGSSIADSRHDISSVFSDTSSSYKGSDFNLPRGRRSLDPSFSTQKSRLMLQDGAKGGHHHRESSLPAMMSRVGGSKPHDSSSAASSDHSMTSQARSVSSHTDSPHSQASPTIPTTPPANVQNKSITNTTNQEVRTSDSRHNSDSVFLPEDKDLEDDNLEDAFEFSRKPSMRKAYGIYDETEKLISQSRPGGKSKTTSNSQSSSDGPTNYGPTARTGKYSDSTGLGLIQEESDNVGTQEDSKVTGSASGSQGRGQIKYAWQDADWLRHKVDIPRGSNLKRTTSEQIAMPSKVQGNVKLTSYDTDMPIYAKPHALTPSNSYTNKPDQSYNATYENKEFPHGPDMTSSHSRTQSEDLTKPSSESDAELKKVQQQALLSFYERKTNTSTGSLATGSPTGKDTTVSMESSMYEAIGGGGGERSSTESVAEMISKTHENLAKSAQRVDSIRRSNSSSSSRSDYMDMSRHDRLRKETDWSRLRSSGSLRYSPDSPDRRAPSNRSSFASENHYEDISVFAPSTPRSSMADSKDTIPDPLDSSAAMDSSMIAPTYQNFPAKRRPPPPRPPRTPSPDAPPPPALPPRKYRDNLPNATGQSSDDVARVGGDKHRINVIPLSKQLHQQQLFGSQQQQQQGESTDVDNSKRDFKSLMTQWENNSPREDNYAAELRKQAQKFSGQQQQQQQQQLNAMPMSFKSSTTKINYSTKFKREPMQPQEATSPVSSTMSSSSSVTPPPPPSSSSSSGASVLTSSTIGASLPTSSSSSSTPLSSSSPALSHQQTSPPSGSAISQFRTQTSQHSPPSSSVNAVANPGGISYVAISNSVHSNAQSSGPPQPLNRVQNVVLEDSRARSSSDISPNVKATTNYSPKQSPTTGQNNVQRERSASDHDILADRKGGPAKLETHFGAAQEAAPSRWRPKRGPDKSGSPNKANQQGEVIEIHCENQDLPPPPPDMLVPMESEIRSNNSSGTEAGGFADESYLGHKSKSSRPIGTYKRSKSAAVLQTNSSGAAAVGGGDGAPSNNNNYKIIGEEENTAMSEHKMASWNSESMLLSHAHTDPATRLAGPTEGGDIKAPGDWSRIQQATPPGLRGHASTTNERIGTIPETGDDVISVSNTPPVRPNRNNGRQLGSSSSSSSSSYSSVSSTSVFSAKPFVVEQPGWVAYRDSSRRVPPPPTPNSAPYDPSQPPPRPAHPSQQTSPNPASQPEDSSPKYSPHRRNVPPPLQSELSSPSSQPISNQSRAPPTLNGVSEDLPLSLPPRDYQRRESAPVRPVVVLPSNIDLDQGVTSPRRRSESSVTSPRGGLDPESVTTHVRQPSQEELECDIQAKALAQELSDKEQKLSEVLSLDVNKKRMQYMDGLFSDNSTVVATGNDVTRSMSMREPSRDSGEGEENTEEKKRNSLPKEYWMSSSKAMMEMELRNNEEVTKDLTRDINDSDSLIQQKEELMEKLHKKLEVLKEAKAQLQNDISENNKLGLQVCELIESRCQNRNERDKFRTYTEDLEKIVRLLLNLSGQLARAENAVQALSPNADVKLRKMTMDKRERLHAKHEEAKLLKEDIDKRSDQLSLLLRERLADDEFADYTHYTRMKSRLTIELQELEDKITLGGEQIMELKKSIPESRVKPGIETDS